MLLKTFIIGITNDPIKIEYINFFHFFDNNKSAS